MSRVGQQLLGVHVTVFGQKHLVLLFVDPVVAAAGFLGLARKLRREVVQPVVHLDVVVGLAGDDQRRPCFVDQDRVDFVDDCVMESALAARRDFVLHVVAQVVEAEFVVGPVRDVGVVG